MARCKAESRLRVEGGCVGGRAARVGAESRLASFLRLSRSFPSLAHPMARTCPLPANLVTHICSCVSILHICLVSPGLFRLPVLRPPKARPLPLSLSPTFDPLQGGEANDVLLIFIQLILQPLMADNCMRLVNRA